MNMTQTSLRIAALALLTGGLIAHAATITGTVTNKTTGKPSAGDTVVLVDVQAGMSEATHTSTDGSGHFRLTPPGNGPYLVRATHQGATYFIAAPTGDTPADIGVYDAAPKVDGVGVTANVIQIEASNGQLTVNERYQVHNTSSPARTQTGAPGFEVILPDDAVLDGAEATRPTSTMPTNVTPSPTGQKGHYTINFPIQPNQGEKETTFYLTYHLPYNGKSFTFKGHTIMATDEVIVFLPKSITFTAGGGMDYKPFEGNSGIQTYFAKGVAANHEIVFSIAGIGSMPREDQGNQGGQSGMGGDQTGNDGRPGGGIGAPMTTPNPLSKYMWWILGALALALVAVAAFLLRRPAGDASAAVSAPTALQPVAAGSNAILQALKDELFAIESEKISGQLSEADYAQIKSALEVVLKRVLARQK
jgi:hypothetical protein